MVLPKCHAFMSQHPSQCFFVYPFHPAGYGMLLSVRLFVLLLCPAGRSKVPGLVSDATIVEANNATMKAMPSGTSMRAFHTAKEKQTVRKLTTMISVEFRIGIRTSLEALNTTWMYRKTFHSPGGDGSHAGACIRFLHRQWHRLPANQWRWPYLPDSWY